MTVSELYPLIRWTHISCVLASGTLFAARGAGVLLGSQWGMTPTVRRFSYLLDTALLGAALLMLYILDLNPFTVGWLSTKIALLLLYIVLGSFALKRARTARAKLLFFLASLLCFAFMLTVARAHNALGFLSQFMTQ
ncbi:SirB2 family protein [Candidatus Aalborgicola defluviihabitans]|jgi:uncharacterized membrane protein SirB2|uniref:SirB2 family protein n=1 Tax=Candidatus Aalborgicola defluviihabitans TaxID=3386187 RepID=UPI0039B9D032